MSGTNNDNDKAFPETQLQTNTLVGNYRIIEKIGAGGMGNVYLAEDINLERKVALKFLSPHLCNSDDACERFKREARAAAALKHPNIVTVYEVGEYQGHPYFAMEYCEGKILKDVIEQGEISLDQAVDLAKDIAEGLREAHEHGVIHRDIKPSNIILDSKGQPKLVDFGLAQIQGRSKLTETGSTMGTLEYMSPEQAEGKTLDDRSDLFSLGIILYEMIAARKPFTGEYPRAISYAILFEEPEPLRRFKSNVPDELQRIVTKLLQKDPNLRFQTSADLISDLIRLKTSGFKPESPAKIRNRVTKVYLPAILFLAVVLILILRPWKLEISTTQEAKAGTPRLAILQLRNLGASEDEYIAYGITEDLIVDMTRLGTMGVAPMRAVIKYNDSDADLQTIANDLDATMIMEGSIRRVNDSVYISAQLTDVASNSNIWADRWAQSSDSLQQVKTILAENLASALSIDSSRVKNVQIDIADTKNPLAYEYYLQAKYLIDHIQTEADYDKGQELLNKAYETDPTFLGVRSKIAGLYILKGDFAKAEKELLFVLSESQRRNLKKVEAGALGLLSNLYFTLNDMERGRKYSIKALEFAQKENYLDLEQSMLFNLMLYYRTQNDYDTVLKMLDRTLQISDVLGDKDKKNEAIYNKAKVFFEMGKIDSSLAIYKHLLDQAIANGNKYGEASMRASIGQIYVNTGEYDLAMANLDTALSILKQMGMNYQTANVLSMIGEIYSLHGDYNASLSYAEQAVKIYDSLGYQSKYYEELSGIAACFTNLGKYDSSIIIYKSVLPVLEEQNPNAASLTRNNMGLAYLYNGQFAKAKRCLSKCFEDCANLGDSYGMCFAATGLGELYYFESNMDSSLFYFDLAHSNSEKLGYLDCQMWAAVYIAAIDALAGNPANGISKLEQLSAKAEQNGLMEIYVMSRRLLGRTMYETAKNEDAQSRARSILTEAQTIAGQNGIFIEKERIGQLLQSYNGI